MRSVLLVVAVALIICVGPVHAQNKKPAAKTAPKIDFKGKAVEQLLIELIPGMGEKDPAARYKPQQQWQDICIVAGAPGNEEKRAEVCKAMAGKLAADVPEQARLWLLKQMEFIGRGESVDAVAKVIDDPSETIRESAVRSLANNPADEAGVALTAKLSASKGKTKIAIVNALGYRKAAPAAAAIATELTNADQPTAQAAARALGRIATAEAAGELGKARATAKDPVRLWISDAYLLCADKMLKDGKLQEASAIYGELQKDDKPRPVRLAALKGSLRAAGGKAGDLAFEMLAAPNRDGREIALAEVSGMDTPSIGALVAKADKLPIDAQVLLLLALSTRNEHTAVYVNKAAQSNNEDLQKAGIVALGRLGDVSSVPSLIELSFSTSKNAGPAKESLVRIVAPGVDEKLIALFKAEKASAPRIGLIGLLEARRATLAVPALLEEAGGTEPALRKAAVQALGKIAEPKDISALIPAVLKADTGGERDAAEKAVVAIAGRISEPEKRAEPILAAVTSANKNDLLPLVGRLGGPKAMAVAKEALSSSAKETKAAAIIALCNWPDFSVSEDLLILAKSAPEANQKTLAFAALVRVNSLSNEHPAKPRLETLKQAMTISGTPTDKKAVLDALTTVKDVDTLRFVLPYLHDKELAQSACKTIVELAHSKMLREPNRDEFHAALDRVMTLCQDRALVERAKKYKAGG